MALEWHHVILSSLNKVMDFHLFHKKPLSEPTQTYCQWGPYQQISMELIPKFNILQSKKCTWKCHLQNGDHFVQALICQGIWWISFGNRATLYALFNVTFGFLDIPSLPCLHRTSLGHWPCTDYQQLHRALIWHKYSTRKSHMECLSSREICSQINYIRHKYSAVETDHNAILWVYYSNFIIIIYLKNTKNILQFLPHDDVMRWKLFQLVSAKKM